MSIGSSIAGILQSTIWERSLAYRKSYDLAVAAALALVGVLVVLFGLNTIALRIIIAVSLVFILPGYALVAAMFPERTLDIPERILLTLGLSIAVAGLGGFMLNWTPWGLRETGLVAVLSVTTIGASCVAFVRRRHQPAGESSKRSVHMMLREGLLFGLACLIGIIAIRGAQIEALRQEQVGFTQLWVLPVKQAEQTAIQLGFKSMESTTIQYKLQLEIDGRVIREWAAIALRPSEQWERTMVLPGTQRAEAKVEAVLYRLDAPENAYRRGVVWLGQASQ
jgi:hypothetical protein